MTRSMMERWGGMRGSTGRTSLVAMAWGVGQVKAGVVNPGGEVASCGRDGGGRGLQRHRAEPVVVVEVEVPYYQQGEGVVGRGGLLDEVEDLTDVQCVFGSVRVQVHHDEEEGRAVSGAYNGTDHC